MPGGHRRATQGCMLPSGSHGLFHQEQGARFAGRPRTSAVTQASQGYPEGLPGLSMQDQRRVSQDNLACSFVLDQVWRDHPRETHSWLTLAPSPRKAYAGVRELLGDPVRLLLLEAGPGARSRSSSTTSRKSPIGLRLDAITLTIRRSGSRCFTRKRPSIHARRAEYTAPLALAMAVSAS